MDEPGRDEKARRGATKQRRGGEAARRAWRRRGGGEAAAVAATAMTMAAMAMAAATKARTDEIIAGRAGLVEGYPVRSPSGFGRKAIRRPARQRPQPNITPPQLVPLNEVLPYAGLPLASEIIHIFLRCHAPASQ